MKKKQTDIPNVIVSNQKIKIPFRLSHVDPDGTKILKVDTDKPITVINEPFETVIKNK